MITLSSSAGQTLAQLGGQPLVTGVSDAEIGYLDGVTSAIQTQLNARAATIYLECTSQFSKTGDTTYATITGMSATVAAGTYYYSAHLGGTANVSGGIKVQIAGVTFTAIKNAVMYSSDTLVGNSAAGGAVLIARTAVFTSIVSQGILVVTVGGTMTLQMAQNASFGTATSVNAASNMTLWKVA